MMLTAEDRENESRLKEELQSERSASKLENLAAALIGQLLGVTVAVAKSGFQHGGDAGTVGRQGRRLRIECKKYSDTTALSERELLGEIDHALSRDPALEAWILVATRDVPEQLEQSLVQKGESLGVPVVILDWKPGGLASLAALCAFEPRFVEAHFSTEAGARARALRPISVEVVAGLERDLQPWSIGLEALRTKSHKHLEKIWSSPKVSNSSIGQNVAGGAQQRKVRRHAVHDSLTKWWNDAARRDAPAAVVGYEGVGKTWATLDWLVDRKTEQPIVLIVPSSTTAELTGSSETAIKRFIADRLYELTDVRDRDHWLRRLDKLLKRPPDEGPVLTIFFDGLNQEPSVEWLKILKVLQAETFEGRIRVIISTRNLHLEDRLHKLRGLIVPAAVIKVDSYELSPGGELDQMLAFEGLRQSDLHPDLIELARTPRLFNLVVRFRERLVDAGQVTVHRLLWEYGRDTFGDRAGRAFSEDDWKTWLQEIARSYRVGVRAFSLKTLGETTQRPDLSTREVFARLSDIIDGQFTASDTAGKLQLKPTVVYHALGVALLSQLDIVGPPTFTAIEAELTQWMDPITGLDQRAEILRAAVSILVERGESTTTPVAGVLVTAWLQTQNVTESHRRELSGLAVNLLDALLDTIEHSRSHTHASARRWALNALRALPRPNASALSTIVARTRRWLSIVSRNVELPENQSEDAERHRSSWFLKRVGVDASGPLQVLGLELQFVDRGDGILERAVPLLLEGFPLAEASTVFEAAAISLAARRDSGSWKGLKWLCLLNKVDQPQTTETLRALSTSVRSRTPEAGVNLALSARAAALLLWLTGEEEDDRAANALDPGLDHRFTYERDYLAKPNSSIFPLERRHAENALNDAGAPLIQRINRTRELWFDPTFKPPPAFVAEVRAAAAAIDVDNVHRLGHYTLEDRNFELLEPALARCAPDLLVELMRRKLRNLATCPPSSRYWAAIHSTEAFLLVKEAEGIAARTLRLSSHEEKEGNELFASNQLLILELQSEGALTQMATIIDADLKDILLDLVEILKQPTPDEADSLLARFGTGPASQKRHLLSLLSQCRIKFSDTVWSWLMGIVEKPNEDDRFAYKALSGADANRFGRVLMAKGWRWCADTDQRVNHLGSDALIEGTMELPFEQIALRLAPWRLLEAARRRGGDPAQVCFASKLVGHFLAAERAHAPDVGSTLSIDRTNESAGLLRFSVTPGPSEEDSKESVGPFDEDAQFRKHMRAFETAAERIQTAQKSGISLFFKNIDTRDLALALQHAPELVKQWLEGMHGPTNDFKRRVRLAEPSYLALCEALMASDANTGAVLWRSLRSTIETRFIGPAYVDEFIHIPFRAPDAPAVEQLRAELLDLRYCHTDKALLDVALAATFNGKADWLSGIIESDKASPLAWRRRRGVVLEGFMMNNSLPVVEAWPEGEASSGYEELRRKSARSRYIEACAHHWWRTYLAAQDIVEGYAAWVLFLHSADRRSWKWVIHALHASHGTDGLSRLKQTHVRLNRDRLRRAMKEREDKRDEHFLGREIFKGLKPWLGEPD